MSQADAMVLLPEADFLVRRYALADLESAARLTELYGRNRAGTVYLQMKRYGGRPGLVGACGADEVGLGATAQAPAARGGSREGGA